MKTTFDLADNILARSRIVAKREGVALKELVEEGLSIVIERHTSKPRQKVRPVTFKGNGLSEAFENAPWKAIRDASYEGHGA